MVLLGKGHSLVIEQAGVGHLDGGFQPVFVGALLLDFENIQAFREECFPSDVLRFALTGDLFGIFRHHFRAVDDIDYKLIHVFVPFIRKIFIPLLRRW